MPWKQLSHHMLSPAHVLRVVSMQRRCRDKMFLEVASNFKCNISNSSTNITKETNCSVTFATYCVCELPLSAVAVAAVSWKKKKSECEISSHRDGGRQKRKRSGEEDGRVSSKVRTRNLKLKSEQQ